MHILLLNIFKILFVFFFENLNKILRENLEMENDEQYLSLPIDADKYTQELYANLSEIQEKINADEIQMIFIAHRYEQTGRIPWNIMSKQEKFIYFLNILIRIFAFIFSLYIFIITLDLMTSAFILLTRSTFGQIFKSRLFLKNPLIALMFGIIITTILQSSSTVTSIIVSMVGSGIVDDVRSVIPMIMGENKKSKNPDFHGIV